uniref:ShKT domain-containing protein n=1 Tax=Romanomermis culicivorax TaxID=13658 RepID=A0A915KPD7_ROMCU
MEFIRFYISVLLLIVISCNAQISDNINVTEIFIKNPDLCRLDGASWILPSPANPKDFQCGAKKCDFPNQLCALNWANVKSTITCSDLPQKCKDLVLGKKVADPPTCEDKASHYCCYWASTGECDKNQRYMKVWCANTCGTCGCSGTTLRKC